MKKKVTSYLEYVSFDPRLRDTLVAKYLTNFRLVGLLIFSILVLGISSYFSLPRRLNPRVEIPIVSVVTVLPGAGPADIESLVTIPIEDALDGVENITSITSSSRESISTTIIEFQSTVTPAEAENKIKNAIDSVTDLPDDAKDPRVAALDFEQDPIWMFSIATAGDEGSLMRFAKRIKDKLDDLPGIDTVSVGGLIQEEIQVLIDREKMKEYGLDPNALSQSLSSAVSSYPSGVVSSSGYSFSIAIDPVVSSVASVRETRIHTPSGLVVTLGDIATVVEAPVPGQTAVYVAGPSMTPHRAVSFTLTKTKTSDIDEAVIEAEAVVRKEIALYDDQFSYHTMLDANKLVQDQYGDLVNNFGSTIILVFLTIMIFLGVRQAVITSFSIPLTILVTLTVMNATGISINFLSLFSLLLSLGLLVDDTIVVIIASTSYYRTGKFTPEEVGILVWRDFIVPIWSTTITTVWAFVPLLLATGIIGEFIKSIPIVVSATLLASTAIAVLITLPLMIVILKPSIPHRVQMVIKLIPLILGVVWLYLMLYSSPFLLPILMIFVLAVYVAYRVRRNVRVLVSRSLRRANPFYTYVNNLGRALDHGFINFQPISRLYQRILTRILYSKRLRRKTVIGVILFSIFSYLLLPMGFVVNEFFPKVDQEQLYIQVRLPEGTTLSNTISEMHAFIDDVGGLIPEARFVQGESGKSLSGGDGGFNIGSSSNSFLLSISLPEEEKRDRSSVEIASYLRDALSGYTKGDLSVIEVSGGPPAGADIQISFLGDDLAELTSLSDKTIEYLKNQEGVTNVAKSVEPGTGKLVFVPDRARLAEEGISERVLGGVLRTVASGIPLESVKFGPDEQDIVFRNQIDDLAPDVLAGIMVDGKSGSVPLALLGSFELKTNPTSIARQDGKRMISVSAAVESGYSVTGKNQELTLFADSLNYPEGYSWQTGGANEENQKSVQSIIQAMLISVILILATMVIQLGSYRKAVIILLTIPLAVSGVFIVFSITGTPLSFPALIGMLALFGIVVNNSIVILEKINQNMKIGMELIDSITDAAASRVEPIFFSSLTTITGLIPITLSDPLWEGTGGAIIAGIFFSGSIMLFFIPVIYFMWFTPSGDKRVFSMH